MTIDTNQNKVAQFFKHNFIVNLFEGGFFGLAISISSYQTILPLFISSYTNSAILIGLIPAIHSAGWQLPQLFFAGQVSRQLRYKPMVLAMTAHERIPFLGLAITAFFLPRFGPNVVLLFAFLMLSWQGLGGGVTAIAWQSLMSKVIIPNRWGIFFGMQGSFFSLFGAIGAVIAGYILDKNDSPFDFTLCFLITFVIMVLSWVILAMTREFESLPPSKNHSSSEFRTNLFRILSTDKNFRWYLIGRMLTSFAVMGVAFYTVYAVKNLGVSLISIGVMTSILFGIQIIANPILGWLGDHWNRRVVMIFGLCAAVGSSFLAIIAQNGDWFYIVFLLAGIANIASWTLGITMTLDFCSEEDRPAYIGLSNTLIAPANIIAPFIGGWLADFASYQSTFLGSVIGGIAAILVFIFFVKDPNNHYKVEITPLPEPEHP